MTTNDATPPEGTGPAVAEPVPADETIATMATTPESAHPYRERYFVPFIFPLMIVVGVVFYVLNVSRIFLASKGTAALVIASVMTAMILFGAAALSSAPKVRTSSLGLLLVGVLVVVAGGGWTVIGHSEEKKVAKIQLGPPIGQLEVTVPAGQLAFSPNKAQVPAAASGPYSVIQITYHDGGAGQHTFEFDDPTVVWDMLEINAANEKKTEDAGFPKAGDYTFYCTIPGHRQAGMQGVITVTPKLKPQKVSGATTASSGA